MSNITAEQALQIPQQLKRQDTNSNLSDQSATPNDGSAPKNSNILGDDLVTLLYAGSRKQSSKIEVEQYKGELGQYTTFVNDTLKNKLAEYNVNPNSKVKVAKNMFGQLEVSGNVAASALEKISQDLNNHQAFKNAFNRLSDQSPTLDYVDNVVKISKAYGVNNTLFSNLLSQNEENNKLGDIAHRYESLKNQQEEPLATDNESIAGFIYQLN